MISYNNIIVQEDLKDIVSRKDLKFEKLKNTTILVTGANGMLATYMIYTLLKLNEIYHYNIKIIALARNKEKAKARLKDNIDSKYLNLLIQDVCEPINISENIDYIIHAAGSASPQFIINDPVGIIAANTKGTFNVFELGRKKKIKKILFLSTREVYGKISDEIDDISEEHIGALDPLDSRSCYPESKRMAENICKSYLKQYNTPYNIVRIAHSYGPGMEINQDGRVMADLISDVVNNRNIILKSHGVDIRAFCYINDAVVGMFLVMLKGKIGEAYNLANETEPIQIKELAHLLVESFKDKRLNVEFKISKNSGVGYSKFKRVKLNTKKIEELNWSPKVKLIDGIKRTVLSFNEN